MLALLAARRRRRAASAGIKPGQALPYHTQQFNGNHRHANGGAAGLGWLLGRPGGGTGSSGGRSSDPLRSLLGFGLMSGAGSGANTSGRPLASSPDGISLHMLLGAGSYGRVYAGKRDGPAAGPAAAAAQARAWLCTHARTHNGQLAFARS